MMPRQSQFSTNERSVYSHEQSNPSVMLVTRAPLYQIDFLAEDIGRRIASSKRKIAWRFGFPNNRAIQRGLSGMECRGEEHEVVLIWSVTAGKRSLFHNGVEIFYAHSRGSKFEHSWNIQDGMVCKVIAYDFPDNSPSGKQYDLLIHGQSFFKFPRIHELGLAVAGGVAPQYTVAAPITVYGEGLPQEQITSHNSGYYNYGRWNRSDATADLHDSLSASINQTRARLNR